MTGVRETTTWFFATVLVISSFVENSLDPFSKQPRIIVEDGNLIFQAAENKNIVLLSPGKGNVLINRVDFSNLVRSQQGISGTSGIVGPNAQDVQSLSNSVSSISDKLQVLEANLTALLNRFDRLIGSGRKKLSNIKISTYMRKINTLEGRVNQLQELLTNDECSSNPCQNGGTCLDTYNGFICHCPENWEGATCSSDVNECAKFAGTGHGCQNGATCYNSPGSYRCECATNWYGVHCAESHDDCSSASHQELCGHGTCINEKRVVAGQPKYKCICDEGWTQGSNGPACDTDINECAGNTNPCSTNPPVRCINLQGTFHCEQCPHGYTGNGRTCYDINECEVNNGGCSSYPSVECINTIGSRTCGPCPAGYVGNGVSCSFLGVCGINRGGCHPLATCVENTAITGTYRECRCPPGYVGSGEGLNGCSQSQVMSCANNPCQNGNCQMTASSFYCVCYPGYTGTLCDQRSDPCYSNPCENGGTCSSSGTSFSCACSFLYEGATCSERKKFCGGMLLSNSGTLKFPDEESSFNPQGICVWYIRVDSDKVINVTFDDFYISNTDCTTDFMKVNDNLVGVHVETAKRYCANNSPVGKMIQTIRNKLYLHLETTSTSLDGVRFSMAWNASEAVCGQELEVATHGSINSPGYPGFYPSGRDCYWVVKVPSGKRIQFHFATLQLEHHDDCSFDFLKIYDGTKETDPLIGSYCTTASPPPLTTSNSQALLHFHSDLLIVDTGFHITYAAVPGTPGCGGTLTTPSGVISSPNFPDVYGNLLVCDWLIRIHVGNKIELKFTDFATEYHENCQFDYLEVYDGSDDASPLLGRYCGESSPQILMSNTNVLYIKFRTDTFVQHTGFRAEYKTICGGTYTELQGSFTSPYFPDKYPSHITCYYHISLPQGHLINLEFPLFSLEHGSDCNYDYVEIRDGESEQSKLVGRYCGDTSTSAPDSFTSTFNELFIKFNTDGYVQSYGFYANYSAIETGCGGVLTNDRGFVGTPRHPEFYPPLITCTWLIRAPPGYIIRLTFEAFAMERHPKCDFDYLLVQDSQGTKMGKFCGYRIPPILTSSDNEMMLTFVADSSVSKEGFNASYVFLDAGNVCGGNYYVESGVIRTPKFPENYPHNMNCFWVLHAENGHQFILNVTSFHLERGDECKYDYLEIRNGAFETSPLIGRYCDENIPTTFTSHSNKLRLDFRSDSTLSHPGFEIFYDSATTGCGGSLKTPQGSIVSPNYPQPYGHNAECSWLIQGSAGSAISIVIIDVDIEEHSTCMFDYLEVFDGPDDRSPSVVKMCNNQQNPGPIRSSSNTFYVRFRTDTSGSGRGFHLSYHALCNNVLNKMRGVIESPNFPNSYPHNHNCTWNISVPMGNNISLAFSHLFLENSSSCNDDYVAVYQIQPHGSENEKSKQLVKYCGTPFPLPPPIEVETNMALVRLVTDSYVTREGFRLEYTIKGCGGEITKPYGRINTPNYPNGYPIATECYWVIKYPPGKRVELTSIVFDIEGSPECIYDYLEVFGGDDDTAPRLLKLCHTTSQSQTISSHGNSMTIRFYSDHSIVGRGFSAFYSQISSGCGGYFTTKESVVLSPNYPSTYNANDECDYLIEVDNTHLVSFTFYEFSLPESINCSKGYVALYDGRDTRDPILTKLCGEMPTNPVINATSNMMLIRLKADGINVGKGFKGQYKSGCGKRLIADNGGDIRSPEYPHTSYNTPNCTWIIAASDPGEKVTLIFTHLSGEEGDCTSGRPAGIEVRDGDRSDSPLIGRYCSTKVPPSITSQGNSLYIRAQMRAVFRAVYGITSSFCGGDYKISEGSFASPDFPNDYPMDTECVWTIQASAGSLVQLSFQEFHMEDSDFCNTDYVEVHENDGGGPLVGRYCGDRIPTNITSSNKLWIKFRSDPLGTAKGFLAHFNFVHGTQLTGTEGIIESPAYPHVYHLSGAPFQWTVTVPYPFVISVQFLEMDIRMGGHHLMTCYFSVTVYDGADDTAPLLGEFCGYQIPEPIISHSNQVFITFGSQRVAEGKWKIRWLAVNGTTAEPIPEESGPSCWQSIKLNSSSSFELVSEGYPVAYPVNMNCTWIFTADPSEHIKITFDDMQLEGNEDTLCSFDRVEIYTAALSYTDNMELNSTLCGRVTDRVVESLNNIMKVVFFSDTSLVMNGFHAVVQTACGGYISAESGSIKSSDIIPYLANAHSSSTNFVCKWVIRVRSRRTVQISFRELNLPSSSGSCSEMYLLLLNGGRDLSPMLGQGKYCGNSVPSVPETSSNEVSVILQVNSFSRGSPQFELHFSEVSVGCGGHLFITEENGYIEINTPNYPNTPPHPMECVWIIMSPAGTRLRLDITDELHFSGYCRAYNEDMLEYIRVLDGGSENARQLARYCDSGHASSVATTGNTMYIHYFLQAEGHGLGGFKARVTTAECGGIIFSFYGTLTSPSYPANYSNALDCEWLLRVQPGYDMTIRILNIDTPPNDNCSLTDYLEVRDENRDGESRAIYCGNKTDTNMRTLDIAGSQAYVRFKSDSAYTGKGFSLSFKAQVSVCGGEYSSPSGVITSPNYPEALGSVRRCMWLIVPKEGRVVTLVFNEFNLPKDEITGVCISGLSVSHLRYRFSSRPENWMELCGTDLPPPMNVGSGSILIKFHTDGLAAGQGFSLTYSTETESECGGILPLPSGILSTPNFTVSNNSEVECRWVIDTESQNQTVLFKFDVLDIPGHDANYCADAFLFFKSSQNYYPGSLYIARFCGNMTERKPIVTSPYQVTSILLYASLDRPFTGIRATYSLNDCGGIMDASNAVITSPGYPNSYPPNMYCHWTLRSSPGNKLQIIVTDMQLEEDCKKDYVLIRNGVSNSIAAIGRFCGKQNPAPIIIDIFYISVIFHSDEYGTAPGFKIITSEVAQGCGGLIHKADGVITSPNYPSSYSNNQECVWTIEVVPGSLVNLTFIDRFDIEMERSCNKDYVQIEDYDDNKWSDKKVTLCGRQTPQENFISKSTKMRITFHSDDQIQGDGFKLIYSTTCGGHFSDKKGAIYSPNYPDKYLNNLDCRYIVGDRQHFLSLTFDPDSFSTEGDITCDTDYIEVYEGNTTAANIRGKYCGSQAPPPLLVFGQVLVRFKTDSSYVSHGFVLNYEVTDCGGYLTDPSGKIHTPKNPQHYLDNMDCTWVIQGQPNRVIVIKFIYFELEPIYNCGFDSLKVYDGNSSGVLLGKLCGRELPPIIKSSSNMMTLQFSTDHSQSMKGFELVYYNTFGTAQNCGGVIVSSNGEFSSLDYDNDGKYEPNLDCSWKLIGEEDKIIKITFTQFNLEPPVNGTCIHDYIEVRDGLFADDPIIARYCGIEKPGAITASSNKVIFIFHSDDKENRQGFHATFTSEQSLCGPTVLTASNVTGTLTSPNWPSTYPPNIYCRWHFFVETNALVSFVLISFADLDIPCGGGDYLNVHPENRFAMQKINPFKLCGSSHPLTFVSPHGLWVSFRSGPAALGRGFKIQYSIAPCSRNYTEDNGALVSPWFMNYSLERNCLIFIKTTPGKTISLYFGEFYVQEIYLNRSCGDTSMKIYDGESSSSPQLANLCGRTLPNPIFSTSHTLRINVTSTRQYSPIHYFISFTTTDKGRGCGGVFSHSNGTFSSPFYPSAYSVPTSCEWKISVPGHHTMMLYFDFFALTSTTGCETNYVEIYEGLEALPARRVNRLCGDDVPAPYHSQGSQLLVKLTTNSSNTEPGFLARFAMNTVEKDSMSYVVQALSPEEQEYEVQDKIVYVSPIA